MSRPRARVNDLLIQPLENETLVYDQRNQKVHCLNDIASAVWSACDGSRTAAEIAASVCRDVEEPHRELVGREIIARLTHAGLVDPDPSQPPERPTRRSALRHLRSAALISAAVTTVLAPLPAAAGTCMPRSQCGLGTVGFCCVNIFGIARSCSCSGSLCGCFGSACSCA